MNPIDERIKVVMIPFVDDKPKRRTWYKYLAKIGTTCGTVIWADKSELNVGDYCYFGDAAQFDLDNSSKWHKYPSESVMHRGYVTDVNSERVFLSLA